MPAALCAAVGLCAASLRSALRAQPKAASYYPSRKKTNNTAPHIQKNRMDIICHAFPAWEGNYVKSTVEITKAIAKQGHRVLYVDYAYTWTDFAKSLFGKGNATWYRMLGITSRLRKIEVQNAHLFVLTLPPVLPANFLSNPYWYDAVNKWNSFFIGRTIRKAAKKLSMTAPVVVNAFNPSYGIHLASKLGEGKLVYYCYDEISAAAWANKHGARAEQAFVPKCDAVIVSSVGLQQKQALQHKAVSVVKNGVDAALFSAKIRPEDLPKIPNLLPNQQVIGYLGSIDDRLDFDLLEQLFTTFANKRFVFVGRVQNEAIRARLLAFSNVFLSGAYPSDALPGWVACMDVCLIPFVKNDFTAGIYPLKINEYLAAGKAVVTTDFAPLDDFSDIVAIADTAETFKQAVKEALFEKKNQKAEQRQAFARKNDWAQRAQQFVSICINQ